MQESAKKNNEGGLISQKKHLWIVDLPSLGWSQKIFLAGP